MKVTVAICTWNRAELLDQTLTRMSQLNIPRGIQWELLVVNNNCTDHTDAVISRHLERLPLRRLFEPKQGHSNARNCAVEAASGELLVWSDDDVLVDPDWLTAYTLAADEWPDAGYFGGPVEPWFPEKPTADLLRYLPQVERAFALVDFGPDVRPLAETEYVFGANLAFRTYLLKRLSFDPHFGRIGKGMIGDDEAKVLAYLKSINCQGVWVGTARVKHVLTIDRANWSYIWRYFVGIGRTSTRRNGIKKCSTLLRAPRWMFGQYLQQRSKSLLGWLVGHPSWVRSYTRAAFFVGCITESRARHASGSSNGLKHSSEEYLLAPLDNILGRETQAAES